MSGAGGGSRLTPTEKEIARKLPLLDEEQQKRYDKFLILGIDAYGKISDQYRLGIVNALLQPISEREQDLQISGHLRDEYFRSLKTIGARSMKLTKRSLKPVQQVGSPHRHLQKSRSRQQGRTTTGLSAANTEGKTTRTWGGPGAASLRLQRSGADPRARCRDATERRRPKCGCGRATAAGGAEAEDKAGIS